MKSLMTFLFSMIFFSNYAYSLSLDEVFSEKTSGKISAAWDKYDLELSKSVKKGVSLSDVIGLSAGATYTYAINSAASKGRHQRLDAFAIKLGVGVESLSFLGASAEAQVTYSRYFPSKKEALKKMPPKPKNFPNSTDKILDVLKIGDAVRVELASDGSIGQSMSSVVNKYNQLLVAASINKGTRYLMEIERVDESKLKLRLMAVRNMGSLSAKASLDPLSLDLGSKLVNIVVNKVFRCDLLSISFVKPIHGSLPVDTLIVDYEMDISKPLIKGLVDQTMKTFFSYEIEKRLGLFKSATEFQQGLMDYVKPLEAEFQKQRSLELTERSLQRSFKGRMLTDHRKFSLGSSCLFESLSSNRVKNISNIRSYDEDEQVSDFLHINLSHSKSMKLLLGSVKKGKSQSADLLLEAEREVPSDPLSLTPVKFLSFYLKKNFYDNYMFATGARYIVDSLQYQVPALADVDFSTIKDGKKKRDVVLDFNFLFDRKVFSRFPRLTKGQYEKSYEDYINGYPQNRFLPRSAENNKGPFDRYIKKDSQWLARVFDPRYIGRMTHNESVSYRVKSFVSLMKSSLFREIGLGYLLSLVDDDEFINKNSSSHLKLRAKGVTGINFPSVGESVSNIHEHIQSIHQTVNKREF